MSKEERHIEFNSLVARYLSGELTREEKLHFQEMVMKDPRKQTLLDENRKVWETVTSKVEEEGYDLDAEWDLFRRRLSGIPSQRSSPRSLIHYAYRIAAVLIIGLVLVFSGIYFTRINGTEQVIAGDQPVEVLLEDGTKVIVNRQSKIRYEKHFSESPRKVTLAGEAWFDVARDTARPFTIHAGDAMVEVLGTSFNVNAYSQNETVEVIVESGVVAVSARQDQQDQIVLRAGNSGIYHKENRELTLYSSSNPNKISWKTRELFFDNTPLQEVAEVVNKVYNANLILVNSDLASCPITVTFRDQSLEAVIRVLEMTLDLEISRTGNQIRLDGPGCEE